MKATLGRFVLPLAASALVFATPAFATDKLDLSVTPDQGRPGDSVSVQATSMECDGATAVSDALQMACPLAGKSGEEASVFGNATVADVEPGTYSVSIKCPGSKHTATTSFTVVEPAEEPAEEPSAEEPAMPEEPAVMPEGAPETGGGALALR